jgi:hypothetical protein
MLEHSSNGSDSYSKYLSFTDGPVLPLLNMSFFFILGQSLVSKQANQMAQTKFRRAAAKTGRIETPPATTATTPTTARRGHRGQ